MSEPTTICFVGTTELKTQLELQVDTTLWNWLEKFITNKKVRDKGLKEYQAEQDMVNKPLREELGITEDLIKQCEVELSETQDELNDTDINLLCQGKRANTNRDDNAKRRGGMRFSSPPPRLTQPRPF